MFMQAWLDDVVAHCENKITVDFPIIAGTQQPGFAAVPLLLLQSFCRYESAAGSESTNMWYRPNKFPSIR
jgi:hypothetical protein